VDRRVARQLADLIIAAEPLPIVELGPGSGVITRELLLAGQPITAVELDPGRAAQLRVRSAAWPGEVRVIEQDMLRFRYDARPHHIVSNVPFGITTPLLRHLLGQRHWQTAALLLQWEVARKRAAVGGTTLLTAAWWPWYQFTLGARVPATAFRPRPSVSGGLLTIRRRREPLVSEGERGAYQRFVGEVFTRSGSGLAAGLRPWIPRRALRACLTEQRLDDRALPRDLNAAQWAGLYRLATRA
jgi:23S rRNA (adenine-N6)-dimethyltransferase